MNEFEDIDRALAEAFSERPSVLSRPSLRDVKQRARRHSRQRSAGVLGACAVVGLGGAAVVATRSPANRTALGDGETVPSYVECHPFVTTTNVVYDSSTAPMNTIPVTTVEVPIATSLDADVNFYTLQQGDNPTSVADRFGVTLEALNAANVATPGYEVFPVGLTIVVSTSPDVTISRQPGVAGTYTLQTGDYPGLLAELFKVTVRELDAINEDVNGYGGFVLGTVINIPFPSQIDATGTTIGFPDSTGVADSTVWPTTTMIGSDVTGILTVYIVQSGDTPLAVATAFDVTLQQLNDANRNTPGFAEWLVGTAVNIPFQDVSATTAPLDTTPFTLTDLECMATTVPYVTFPATTVLEDTTLTTNVVTETTFALNSTLIQIVNCSSQEGVASIMSYAFAAEGFNMAEADTGTIDLMMTKVIYNPDDPAALFVAQAVARYLSDAVVEASGPIVPALTTGTWAPGSSVIVLLGDDLAGKTLAQISAEGGPPSTLPEQTTTTS